MEMLDWHVRNHKLLGSCLRKNISDGEREYLRKRVLSDVVENGPIMDECEKMLGWKSD